MRLKVEFRTRKLLVAVPNELVETGKVSDLLWHLTKRFRADGDTVWEEDNQFIEMYLDGYMVSPNDLVKDVVSNNDALVVHDNTTWLQNNVKACTSYWHTLGVVDFEDGEKRWASVGWAEPKKSIFISMGKSHNKTSKLVFVSLNDLKANPKDGKAFVGQIKGKPDWFAEAHLIIENGECKAVELSVKASTDPRATIERVELQGLNATKPSAGKIQRIQEGYSCPDKVYTVPEERQEGPKLDDSSPEVPQTVPENNTSTGNCPVEFKQSCYPFVEQKWQTGNEGYNRIHCEFLANCRSPHGAAVNIVELSSEYLNQEGAWVSVGKNNTYWSHKDSPYYYRLQKNGTEVQTLRADFVDKLSLTAIIPIKGSCINDQRRVFSCLPSRPLKVRFTWTDSEKRSSSIVIEYTNPPPEVKTRKEFEEEVHNPAHIWIQCDDTISEERLWIGGYFDAAAGKLEVWNKSGESNRTCYLTQSSLRSLAWTAASESKSEIDLEDLSYKSRDGVYSITTTLLVDAPEKHPYGLTISLKTQTSSATKSFLLPKF